MTSPSINLKVEMQKLYGETCEMLKEPFDALYNDCYYELSESYNNEQVEMNMLRCMYSKLHGKYEALKGSVEFLTNLNPTIV